jgi:hypothetical protein
MTAITGPYSFAPNAANPLLGRGMLFLDNLSSISPTLVRTGQQAIGNVTSFQIENKVEIKEKYESMDPASSLYARGVTRQTVSLKITGDEYTLDNLARALLGNVVTDTGAGATITGETITPAGGSVLNRYYDLANRNITTFTSLTQEPSTVLTLGTDYTVDLLRGRIYLLPTSTVITPGSVLEASYVYGAYTYNSINVASQGTVEAYVRFLGNPIKGPTYEAEFWHVSFTPSGELGFIADDFGNWTLEGEVIADSVGHPSEPIGRLIQTA